MGFRERLAGTHHRDMLTERALAESRSAASKGLREFTITVHSSYGGSALLPRLVPHVVSALQDNGFAVVNIVRDEWAYNAHLTVRAG
jgi:hypothetical protein